MLLPLFRDRKPASMPITGLDARRRMCSTHVHSTVGSTRSCKEACDTVLHVEYKKPRLSVPHLCTTANNLLPRSTSEFHANHIHLARCTDSCSITNHIHLASTTTYITTSSYRRTSEYNHPARTTTNYHLTDNSKCVSPVPTPEPALQHHYPCPSASNQSHPHHTGEPQTTCGTHTARATETT